MSALAIIIIAIVVVTAVKLAGKPASNSRDEIEKENDFIDLMEDLDAIDDD